MFGPKHQLSKSDFVNQLCSVWNEGMSKENVIVGFQSTGKFKENLTFLIVSTLTRLILVIYIDFFIFYFLKESFLFNVKNTPQIDSTKNYFRDTRHGS